MLVNKDVEPASHTDERGYEQELKDLYARRYAIDMLIQSLQNYRLIQSQAPRLPKRKLA
jgi:hypothetical protein